jgi:hypothetical protein
VQHQCIGVAVDTWLIDSRHRVDNLSGRSARAAAVFVEAARIGRSHSWWLLMYGPRNFDVDIRAAEPLPDGSRYPFGSAGRSCSIEDSGAASTLTA